MIFAQAQALCAFVQMTHGLKSMVLENEKTLVELMVHKDGSILVGEKAKNSRLPLSFEEYCDKTAFATAYDLQQ